MQADGLRAVTGGLKASDRVIINGLQRAVPGSKIDVEEGKIVAVAAPVDDGTKPLPKPAGVAPTNAPARAVPSVPPAPTAPATPSATPATPKN